VFKLHKCYSIEWDSKITMNDEMVSILNGAIQGIACRNIFERFPSSSSNVDWYIIVRLSLDYIFNTWLETKWPYRISRWTHTRLFFLWYPSVPSLAEVTEAKHGKTYRGQTVTWQKIKGFTSRIEVPIVTSLVIHWVYGSITIREHMYTECPRRKGQYPGRS
jgi:hypothetical protein